MSDCTIDGVWIGDSIYWLLTPSRISTLYKSLRAKSSSACSVFTRRFFVTDFNIGDSSASRAQVLCSQTPVQNWTWSASESGSELLYDGRFTANQFVLATSPLRPTIRIFIFQLNTCRRSPYLTSSLTRGWVRRLKLLLVLASAVILRSESRVTHDHILLSQIRDSPNLEGQLSVFISTRNRVAQLCPLALGFLFVASYDSQSYCGVDPASTRF
jgi:hypothetical protein